MASAISFAEARKNQLRRVGDGHSILGGVTLTQFFGVRQALLTRFDPGKVSLPHFHRVDQFQVVVGGGGKLGRHVRRLYCVHFSRAYTPYGRLAADPHDELLFFGLRRHEDPGSQRLPEQRANPRQNLRPSGLSPLKKFHGSDVNEG